MGTLHHILSNPSKIPQVSPANQTSRNITDPVPVCGCTSLVWYIYIFIFFLLNLFFILIFLSIFGVKKHKRKTNLFYGNKLIMNSAKVNVITLTILKSCDRYY